MCVWLMLLRDTVSNDKKKRTDTLTPMHNLSNNEVENNEVNEKIDITII